MGFLGSRCARQRRRWQHSSQIDDCRGSRRRAQDTVGVTSLARFVCFSTVSSSQDTSLHSGPDGVGISSLPHDDDDDDDASRVVDSSDWPEWAKQKHQHSMEPDSLVRSEEDHRMMTTTTTMNPFGRNNNSLQSTGGGGPMNSTATTTTLNGLQFLQ